MAADWEEGREMEVEAILGEAVRAARERGIEVPRVHSMYALLKSAQRNRDERRDRANRSGRL